MPRGKDVLNRIRDIDGDRYKTERLAIRVPPAQMAKLRSFCEKYQVSMSETIRESIGAFLEEVRRMEVKGRAPKVEERR